MKDTIFRKYDIRGKVGSEIVIDNVYDLTKAILFYAVQQEPNIKTIAVGMDGRTHSPAIKENVCKAILDSGLNVLFVGTCPTPVVYFAMHTESVQAGIMITASHNPGEYNGMKLCLGKESIWGDQIQEIKKIFHEKKYITSAKAGEYLEKNLIDLYIDWMTKNFSHLVGFSGSVMVDCGNGAAGTVMPQLIEKMNWPNIKLLYQDVDGTYPNHEADPTVAKNMEDLKKILLQNQFDFGLGLDGDCDRMAPMTKEGFLVPGDQLLSVFARGMLEEHPNLSVVFDIKGSSGLIELLNKWGMHPYMAPSGYSFVKREMKKRGALLAGELSCHFIFSDRYFGFDDGIYAMMRLLEIVQKTKKTLQELLVEYPKKISSPDFRIPCDDAAKFDIVDGVKNRFLQRKDAEVLTIDGVRATMDYGWGSLRASNTQPVLSLRVEADSHDGFNKVKEDFFQALKLHFDEKFLKEKIELGS